MPNRRTKALEYVDGLEFEFYLCEKLGHRTVARLRETMSNLEFLFWQMYYARKAQRNELEAARRA